MHWRRWRRRAIQGFVAVRRHGSRAVPHTLGVPMVGFGRGRGDGRRTRGDEDRVQPLRALHQDEEEPQRKQGEDGDWSSAKARHGGIVARPPDVGRPEPPGERRRQSVLVNPSATLAAADGVPDLARGRPSGRLLREGAPPIVGSPKPTGSENDGRRWEDTAMIGEQRRRRIGLGTLAVALAVLVVMGGAPGAGAVDKTRYPGY